MTTNATIAQKTARRKLSLLELASDLDNVSKACKIIGYSRQQFYEICRNFQPFGSEGLHDKARGSRVSHLNRLSEEFEQVILDYCLEFPTHGSLKVSQQLLLRGIHIGSGAIKGVWQRNNHGSKHQRLLLLERFDPEFRERHIEVE